MSYVGAKSGHRLNGPRMSRFDLLRKSRAVMIQCSISDIEYEIEPAVESVATVRYPHQQFALE
jgi:hypothetical protein